EANLEPLLVRQVDSRDACHGLALALPLLVAGVRADDHGRAVPLDHAAALTHRLHGRANFHGSDAPKRRGFSRTAKPHAVGHRSKAALARVRIRGPSAVIATVCSKWAASDSSTEEIDQSSSWTYTSGRPAVIIGSIARVIPSWRSGPRPGGP